MPEPLDPLTPTLNDSTATPRPDSDCSDNQATIHVGATPAAPYVVQEDVFVGPRYTRTAEHAKGGMGQVWLARDAAIGRDVALKDLRADAGGAPAVLRFLREARITGQLEHPGVVPVYELGRDARTGRPFYVMRFIRGRTLSEVVAAFHKQRQAGAYDSMELVTLLTAFVSVCNTIGYAHSHGIVHRDLKGENIILGDFGEVVVLDWGLAKRVDEKEESAARGARQLQGPDRTIMGEVMGTPGYMAPEQAQGRLDLIGPCTDIFGLGAVLYEILSGVPPFPGSDTREVLQKARRGVIVPPRQFWVDVPPGLEGACLKALARKPKDRHARAIDLGHEIQGWQDRQRRQAEEDLRHAYERLRRQQAALVALMHAEVVAGPDLTATFRKLVEAAAQTLNVERVSIWRFTADRQAIRCHALYELTPAKHSAGMELAADSYPRYFEALSATDVIAAEDAQQDPRTSEFRDSYLIPLGIGAMMEVPVHPDAVLCHEHVGGPRVWSPDEQLFAIAVGHLAAHAITHWEGTRR